MHTVAVELAIRRGAKMVFHVAGAFDRIGRRRAAFEFMEDGAVRLGDDDLAHAERTAPLDDLLKRRDHGLAAVEAEALGSGEFHVAEFFEAFGLDQLVEDGALAFAGERNLLVRSLDALLDPALLRGAGNVEEFDAKRLAIGPPQDSDDLAD